MIIVNFKLWFILHVIIPVVFMELIILLAISSIVTLIGQIIIRRKRNGE